MRASKNLVFAAVLAATALAVGASAGELPPPVEGEAHFLDGYPARNSDGTINVVVECPAGTIIKWEVNEDGILRVQPDRLGIGWKGLSTVRYLAYPGNYGMIPQTLLPREVGGEGEPLDVVLLGGTIAHGTVQRARLVGAIALLDGEEQDDKLIAVVEDSPLGHVGDISELEEGYPGILSIIETWFTSYKGVGKVTSFGFVGAASAQRLLDAAMRYYRDQAPAAVAAGG